MSIAEIKEELTRMTRVERGEIEKILADLREPEDSAPPRVREVGPNDPGVAEAMDKVFQTHHELLRRLAQ